MKQKYEGSAAYGKLGSESFRLTVFVNGKEQDERSTEHYGGYFEVVGRLMRWDYLCFDCLTEIGYYF
jgi:hypothetical protein